MNNPKLQLILLLITTALCFYVMHTSSTTNAALIITNQRIAEEANLPDRTKQNLSAKLLKQATQMDTNVNIMITFIPFLGLGIGSSILQVKENQSNKSE